MIQNRLIAFSLGVLTCCGISSAFAAEKQKSQARLGAKKPADQIASVLKRWDQNGDGVLQPEEIPKSQRKKMAGYAKSQGLDPSRPMPIAQLSKKSEKLKKNSKQQGGFKKEQTQAVKRKEANPENDKAFGKSNPPKRTDFGKSVKSEDDKAVAKEQAESKDQQRLKLLVRSMMYQNDKNRNGRLEKNEWVRLQGNPGASDRNKDGVLTSAELADHLAGFGSRERDVTTRIRPKAGRRSPAKRSGKQSYRFLTPHERLPEGLPAWFMDRDMNLDGQLSLKEFASSVSAATVEKFARLDLNRDGFLVAKEYLKATDVK